MNHEDEIIGVLQLINARMKMEDSNLLHRTLGSHLLASQAAIALTNMQFMQDIENPFGLW